MHLLIQRIQIASLKLLLAAVIGATFIGGLPIEPAEAQTAPTVPISRQREVLIRLNANSIAERKDVIVHRNDANRNFITSPRAEDLTPELSRIQVSTNIHTLMEFDLASHVPAGAIVNSSNLILYGTNDISGQAQLKDQIQARVYRMTQPNWKANEATWNRYNATSVWTRRGGDRDDTMTDLVTQTQWLPDGQRTEPLPEYRATADLTAMVRDALTLRNNRLLLLLTCRSDAATCNNSYTSSNNEESLRPSVRITYTETRIETSFQCDLSFVLDVSSSMRTRDDNNFTRAEYAIQGLTKLVDWFEYYNETHPAQDEIRVSLNVFATGYRAGTMLGTDYTTMRQLLANPDFLRPPGGLSTSLGKAIEMATKDIYTYAMMRPDWRPEAKRSIVLLTDGEESPYGQVINFSSDLDPGTEPMRHSDVAKSYGIDIYGVAIGEINLLPMIASKINTPSHYYVATQPSDVVSTMEQLVGSVCGKDVERPPEGGISGYKFNDENRNGVRDSSEAGLNGWTLKIVSEDGLIEKVTTTRNDTTGNPGFYDFTALPKDKKYRVFEDSDANPDPMWAQTTPSDTLATLDERPVRNIGNSRQTSGCNVQIESVNTPSWPNDPNRPIFQGDTFPIQVSFRIVNSGVSSNVKFLPLAGMTLQSYVPQSFLTRMPADYQFSVDTSTPARFSTTFNFLVSDQVALGPQKFVISTDNDTATGAFCSYTGFFNVVKSPNYDLSIQLTPAQQIVTRGDTVNYVMTATNHGPEPVLFQDIFIEMSNPAMRVLSATQSPIPNHQPNAASASTTRWTSNISLAPNQTFGPFTISMAADLEPGNYQINACTGFVSAVVQQRDTNPANNCTSVGSATTSILTVQPLKIRKVWSDTSTTEERQLGATSGVQANLIIENASSTQPVNGITMRDILSVSCNVSFADSCQPNAWDQSVTWSNTAGGVPNGASTLVWNNLSLNPGQSRTFTIAGAVVNQALLAPKLSQFGEGQRCNTLQTTVASLPVQEFDLCWNYGGATNPPPPPPPGGGDQITLLKSASPVDVDKGSEVTFVLQVKNDESANITNRSLRLRDTLPSVFDYENTAVDCKLVSVNNPATTQNCTSPGQQVSAPTVTVTGGQEQLDWNIRDIPGDQIIQYTFRARVKNSVSLDVCPFTVFNKFTLTDTANAAVAVRESGPTAVNIYAPQCVSGNIYTRSDEASGDGIRINGSDIIVDPESIISSNRTISCGSQDICDNLNYKIGQYQTTATQSGLRYEVLADRMNRNVTRLRNTASQLPVEISGGSRVLRGQFDLQNGKQVAGNDAVVRYPDGRVWIYDSRQNGGQPLTIQAPINFIGKGTILVYGDLRVVGSGAVQYCDRLALSSCSVDGSKNNAVGFIVLPTENAANNGNVTFEPGVSRVVGIYYAPGSNATNGIITFAGDGNSPQLRPAKGIFMAKRILLNRTKIVLLYNSLLNSAEGAPPGFRFSISPSDQEERP